MVNRTISQRKISLKISYKNKKKSKRKYLRKKYVEERQNLKVITENVKEANALENLFASSEFESRRHFNCGSLELRVDCFHASSLDPTLRDWAFELCKSNVKESYEETVGWNRESKFLEMTEDAARYLFVRNIDNDEPLAFSHFRFDTDFGEEVLYCYELHVVPEARGKGVGKFLLNLLELMSATYKMSKVILTVFKSNEDAIRFYRRCNYEEDSTSLKRSPYLIMSKYNEDCTT